MADSSEMPSNPSFFRRHATAIWLIYWTILVGLLHWPKLPPPPIRFSKEGWVAHFTTFAILAGLCLFAGSSRTRLDRTYVIRWALILLAFGALSETLQPLSNRYRDLADFIANASGILVVMGLAFARIASRSTPHTRQTPQ